MFKILNTILIKLTLIIILDDNQDLFSFFGSCSYHTYLYIYHSISIELYCTSSNCVDMMVKCFPPFKHFLKKCNKYLGTP